VSRYSQSKWWFQFEMCAEPVGNYEKLFSSPWVCSSLPQVVVSQSVLRDRDGIVLPADLAVIVEQRDAFGVVGSLVVGLIGEEHVVLAEFVGDGVWILRRGFVPEREMALAAENIGAEDASVVGEMGHGEPSGLSSRWDGGATVSSYGTGELIFLSRAM